MLIGNIEALSKGQYAYPEAIHEALEFLRQHDFRNMADGKYPIKGDKCFVLLQRYKTRPLSECHPESHRKFVDIQYVVEGEEYLGWCPFSPDLKTTGDYDEEKDVVFYEQLVPESNLVLQPGGFAVLFPEDVHRPCVSVVDGEPAQVTKAVVKVSVDLVDIE